jgi:hypothetical protein
MAQLDLGELSQHYRVSLEPQEDPAERAHRHRQELLDTVIGQIKSVLLFLFGLGVGGIMTWYCLGILTGAITVSGASPAVTAEAHKWAMAILSTAHHGKVSKFA